jgi:hypothetical protein
MGQLVFQATLGGQVNLVGPNTASTFNINVPATAGNMVTTGDTGTVTKTMLATGVYTAPGTIGSGTANSGAFTTLSASSTVSGTGFSTYLASPPAIGGTAAAAGAFTTLSATGVTTVQAGTVSLPAITTSGDTNTGIFFPAADTIAFSEGGTEAARFDSAGNFGLGVTPSAWSRKAFQIEAGGSAAYLAASGGTMVLGTNLRYNSGDFYIGNGSAAYYAVQADGKHVWATAPSGTAGNTITFTQAMTLTASSELALGGTTVYNSASGRVSLNLNGSTMAVFFGNGTTRSGSVYHDNTDMEVANDKNGILAFKTNSLERARIDSSGNLLVGATSNPSGSRLNVEGTRAATFTSTQTNAAGVSVGNTSSNSDEPAIAAGNGNSGSSGVAVYTSSLGNGNGAQANTNCFHFKAVTQGVALYYLYGNGTSSFTSDLRLKKNITTARNGYAEDLCKLRVVKYNWNTAPEGEAQELGLIAQEVEKVFPGLVQEAADEIQDIKPKVFKASVLPMMLLKAIQEQQALITSLTARITALEGN